MKKILQQIKEDGLIWILPLFLLFIQTLICTMSGRVRTEDFCAYSLTFLMLSYPVLFFAWFRITLQNKCGRKLWILSTIIYIFAASQIYLLNHLYTELYHNQISTQNISDE